MNDNDIKLPRPEPDVSALVEALEKARAFIGGQPVRTYRDCRQECLSSRGVREVMRVMSTIDATTPVAWRWRWKDLPDAGWQLSSVGGWRDTEHIEAQPLYLHPPHQPKRTVTYVCPVCAASLEKQE